MKRKFYEAHLAKQNNSTIYLNINELNKGQYELRIIQRNKIIKRIHFKKE